MLIFAHVFAGAFLGLEFRHLSYDRRAIPLCIAASILPDVIDKSLGLAFPLVLGGGRTVFHSLMIVGAVLLLCLLLFVRSRFVLLGVGVVCALLLHQIFDDMWTLPANWFYPLLGTFQGQMIPDYFGTYFWLEITNPSEWMFLIASVAILAESYGDMIPITRDYLPYPLRTNAYTLVVAGLLITGLYLVAAGLSGTTGTFISPSSYQVPTVMAGVLALGGAVIMRGETFETPLRAVP
jgi:membrane-bound metal-dependent hydrolase YbcI (DUF457 family)